MSAPCVAAGAWHAAARVVAADPGNKPPPELCRGKEALLEALRVADATSVAGDATPSAVLLAAHAHGAELLAAASYLRTLARFVQWAGRDVHPPLPSEAPANRLPHADADAVHAPHAAIAAALTAWSESKLHDYATGMSRRAGEAVLVRRDVLLSAQLLEMERCAWAACVGAHALEYLGAVALPAAVRLGWPTAASDASAAPPLPLADAQPRAGADAADYTASAALSDAQTALARVVRYSSLFVAPSLRVPGMLAVFVWGRVEPPGDTDAAGTLLGKFTTVRGCVGLALDRGEAETMYGFPTDRRNTISGEVAPDSAQARAAAPPPPASRPFETRASAPAPPYTATPDAPFVRAAVATHARDALARLPHDPLATFACGDTNAAVPVWLRRGALAARLAGAPLLHDPTVGAAAPATEAPTETCAAYGRAGYTHAVVAGELAVWRAPRALATPPNVAALLGVERGGQAKQHATPEADGALCGIKERAARTWGVWWEPDGGNREDASSWSASVHLNKFTRDAWGGRVDVARPRGMRGTPKEHPYAIALAAAVTVHQRNYNDVTVGYPGLPLQLDPTPDNATGDAFAKAEATSEWLARHHATWPYAWAWRVNQPLPGMHATAAFDTYEVGVQVHGGAEGATTLQVSKRADQKLREISRELTGVNSDIKNAALGYASAARDAHGHNPIPSRGWTLPISGAKVTLGLPCVRIPQGGARVDVGDEVTVVYGYVPSYPVGVEHPAGGAAASDRSVATSWAARVWAARRPVPLPAAAAGGGGPAEVVEGGPPPLQPLLLTSEFVRAAYAAAEGVAAAAAAAEARGVAAAHVAQLALAGHGVWSVEVQLGGGEEAAARALAPLLRPSQHVVCAAQLDVPGVVVLRACARDTPGTPPTHVATLRYLEGGATQVVGAQPARTAGQAARDAAVRAAFASGVPLLDTDVRPVLARLVAAITDDGSLGADPESWDQMVLRYGQDLSADAASMLATLRRRLHEPPKRGAGAGTAAVAWVPREQQWDYAPLTLLLLGALYVAPDTWLRALLASGSDTQEDRVAALLASGSDRQEDRVAALRVAQRAAASLPLDPLDPGDVVDACLPWLQRGFLLPPPAAQAQDPVWTSTAARLGAGALSLRTVRELARATVAFTDATLAAGADDVEVAEAHARHGTLALAIFARAYDAWVHGGE